MKCIIIIISSSSSISCCHDNDANGKRVDESKEKEAFRRNQVLRVNSGTGIMDQLSMYALMRYFLPPTRRVICCTRLCLFVCLSVG